METKGPRILVVDDDRKELDKTLNTIRTNCASYEARIADGAYEGLDYLFGRGRFHERRFHPLPDLVLLDVGMVPLDGVEVLKRISEADFLRKIPVALLCETEEEKQRAIKEGVPACAFVVKPISPDSLRGLLRQRSKPTAASETQ
jgi:two-component system response regulator